MSAYFVAGGVFQDLDGNGLFSLLCPGPGELPYVMEEAKKPYLQADLAERPSLQGAG